MTNSSPEGSWAERAAEIASTLEGLLEEPEKVEEGGEELDEVFSALLARTEVLVAEIETSHPGALDDSARSALEDLVRASKTLRERCCQGMDQLAGQRAALRQGDRALQGYAAVAGVRDGRYLSDRS